MSLDPAIRERAEINPTIATWWYDGVQAKRDVLTVLSELEVALANLAATEEALLDATDRMEQTRALCREQIYHWRAQYKEWKWIKAQPCAKAFYGPLAGS